MISIIPLKSLEHSDLAPYRSLRQPVEHLREGIFIAEGEKVVRRLLESTLETLSILITPEWLALYQPLIERRQEMISVFVAEKKVLETIVGFNLHQGIMALGKVPRQSDLSSVLTHSPSPHLIVALDGLTNSENLGVLVRNSVAFGTQAILVGETSSSPYLRRAVRNSMGTIFIIPIIHCQNLAEKLQALRNSYQFKIFATCLHNTEHNIRHADFTGNCCIVFGSEGDGISPRILSACDMAVTIPMQIGVDSLNVASAGAVFLYEVTRQRNKLLIQG